MCCVINTDTLLANLFAKGVQVVSIFDLVKLLKYIGEGIHTEVVSDLSRTSVLRCASLYPNMVQSKDGTVATVGSRVPDPEYFMDRYSKPTAKHIDQLTDAFLATMENAC